jgi:RNA polymerase sigma-70 factor (sigma-E family)
LLRVAYLLTRDWALAEDLLQTSLAKTWSVWRRIEGDPEPYVRRVLVNTYTSWWRRRWNGERPASELPERPSADSHREVDDRDQVVRALRRLPRQQRAVLVLRYYEDLSEAEIAETLGISGGTVKSHAAKGLANLRLDPSLAAAGLHTDGEEPAGTARLAAVTERVHQRRRQKVTAAVAACAVVLAVLLGYALSPHRRTAPQPATTPSPETVNGFPRFQAGTEVTTTTTLTAADGRIGLGWSPPKADVTFFVRCSSSTTGVVVFIAFTVGDKRLGAVGCEGTPSGRTGAGSGATWSPETLLGAGVPAHGGVDVKIDRAEQADSGESTPVPADFVVDIAVGVALPDELYPYPPAPSILPSLFTNGFDQRSGSVHLDSVPKGMGEPYAPRSITIPWGDWDVHTTLNSPGRVQLSLNGIVLSKCANWDYVEGGCEDHIGPGDQRLKGLKLHPGDPVTLTVTPIAWPDAWQVWLAPA